MTLSNSISNIFGVSPIKPIQNHMAEVISCVTKLEDFLNATFEPSRRPLPIPALALRQAALGAIWHGVV